MLFYVFSPKMEIIELNIIISSTLNIGKFNRVNIFSSRWTVFSLTILIFWTTSCFFSILSENMQKGTAIDIFSVY